MSMTFEVVVYTASLSSYADPLLNLLDPLHCADFRLFREHCRPTEGGGYVKDLAQLGRNLKDVVIIDNLPSCYAFQPENALPIPTWLDDSKDTHLSQLTPILERLARCYDVRNFIKLFVRDGRVDYIRAAEVLRFEKESRIAPASRNEEPTHSGSFVSSPAAEEPNLGTWMTQTLDQRREEKPHKAVEVVVSTAKPGLMKTQSMDREKLMELVVRANENNNAKREQKTAGGSQRGHRDWSAEKSSAPGPARVFSNLTLRPQKASVECGCREMRLRNLGTWKTRLDFSDHAMELKNPLRQSMPGAIVSASNNVLAKPPSTSMMERMTGARIPLRPALERTRRRGNTPAAQSYVPGEKKTVRRCGTATQSEQLRLFAATTSKKPVLGLGRRTLDARVKTAK